MIRRGPKVPGMGSDCCCGPTRVGTQHGNHCPHVAIYMKYNEKFSCSARCERDGLERKLSAKELMFLNCGVGEDS